MSNEFQWNEYNKAIIEEFRANGGKDGVLLLHTTGAKSGQPRTNPLAYLADGERLVVVASKAGAPTNPDWYYNIVANPQVIVEVGSEQFHARATIAAEPERTQLYKQTTTLNPINAEYQRKTTRVIPVIIFTRLPSIV
jgi:deazaflavin-dependent oxidoreductase (nitroreductase family)